MSKIIIPLSICIGIISAFFLVSATPSVFVSAVVGLGNHAPIIQTIIPSSDPKLLGRNKIQNYSIYFRDDEKDTVTYTISPMDGYVNPLNGAINRSDYDTFSGAFINFTYLAPGGIPLSNPTTITITLNDSTTLIHRDIHLYIY
jgi:hypothetical protein